MIWIPPVNLLEPGVEVTDWERHLKEIVATLDIPKGIKVEVTKDLSIRLTSSSVMLGNQILQPLTDKVIKSVKEQISGRFSNAG